VTYFALGEVNEKVRNGQKGAKASSKERIEHPPTSRLAGLRRTGSIPYIVSRKVRGVRREGSKHRAEGMKHSVTKMNSSPSLAFQLLGGAFLEPQPLDTVRREALGVRRYPKDTKNNRTTNIFYPPSPFSFSGVLSSSHSLQIFFQPILRHFPKKHRA